MRNVAGRWMTGCILFALGFSAGCGGGASAPPAVVVAISPSGSQAIDQGQSLSLTATVTNDSTNAGVSWSVSGGGSLSGSTITAATYTAPATVSAATTATVTATSVAHSASIATHTIVVNPPPAITTAGTLTAGTVNAAYSATLAATGGVPGYTWTVNGTPLATNGTSVGLTSGLGLSVSNTGNNTLNVTGTPTGTGTVTFTASVTDSAGTTFGPKTYTISVSTTYSISGSVNLSNYCGGGSSAVPGVTVSINTTPVQTATTDSNGNFTLSGIANGSYTLTPSIIGPSAVFYPATQPITITGASSSGDSFSVALGYTVSGAVSYSGSKTGRVYVTLSNNCGGSGGPGTSISSAGSFTIRGVAPGTYTLQSWMDNLGTTAQNASNPTGSTANVTVSTANLTGANVSLSDPAAVTLATAPTLQGVSGFNTAALAQFKAITDNNGIEQATSYTLQWSTSQIFTTVAGSQTFPAVGMNGSQLWFLNGATNSSLTNTSVYYFRAFGTAGSSTSPNSAVFGPVTIGAPTGGNTITGTVTFTGTATGPLYTGFYNTNTGVFYGDYIAHPVSPQAYTVQVPSGSAYFQAGVLDQDNNGVVDAGDVQNANGNLTATAISGPATLNLSLPTTSSTASVTTQNFQNASGENYYLDFQIQSNIKLPVAVTLVSGPNVVTPIDIGACPSGCGQGYQYVVNLNTTAPQVGDTYGLQVTYSDGTSETLNAAVTGVLTSFATNLSPTTGTSTSTTPTFTWTDPANASNYTYSFSLNDSNGNTIWQIPGQNSNTGSFSSSITSITWGTDPTGGGSAPSVGSLTSGATYYWQIQVTDSFGNTAIQQVSYQP